MKMMAMIRIRTTTTPSIRRGEVVVVGRRRIHSAPAVTIPPSASPLLRGSAIAGERTGVISTVTPHGLRLFSSHRRPLVNGSFSADVAGRHRRTSLDPGSPDLGVPGPPYDGPNGDGGPSPSAAASAVAVIRGEVLDLATDLRTLRPGDRVDVPYEVTVSEGMQDLWQSAFHSQDRIHTSR